MRWRVPPNLDPTGVAFYGEPLLAEVITQQVGVAFLEPPLDWLVRIPQEFLRRRVEFSTLAHARTLRSPIFVKPADGKSFAARVYPSGCELPTDDLLPGTTAVISSEPVNWELEFRLFCPDGVVLAASGYARNGRGVEEAPGELAVSLDELEDARRFGGEVLAATTDCTPPAVVIDVGIVTGRGWAVIEANPAFASGIYGADPAAALDVVARACVIANALTEAEKKFVIQRGAEPRESPPPPA